NNHLYALLYIVAFRWGRNWVSKMGGSSPSDVCANGCRVMRTSVRADISDRDGAMGDGCCDDERATQSKMAGATNLVFTDYSPHAPRTGIVGAPIQVNRQNQRKAESEHRADPDAKRNVRLPDVTPKRCAPDSRRLPSRIWG